MEKESVYEFVKRNPQRSQAFFLACIDKPRSVREIGEIWNKSSDMFFLKRFHKEMINHKLITIAELRKAVLFYANFEGIIEAFKEELKEEKNKEIVKPLENSLDVIKKVFETKTFREFWTPERVRKIFTWEDLRSWVLDTVFGLWLSQANILLYQTEELKANIEEAKERMAPLPLLIKYPYPLGKDYFTPISKEFLSYIDEEKLKEIKILRNTELYNFISKTAGSVIKTLNSFFKFLNEPNNFGSSNHKPS